MAHSHPDMAYAVIMAGGIGSRFWPQSRENNPKQFLAIHGEDTLIRNTMSRLRGIIPDENVFVVTHRRYVDQTREQLPTVPVENILAEPVARNTGPCIALAAIKLLARDPDAIMIALPADHVIRNTKRFHKALRSAIDKAQEKDTLVTIGIEPTHPETGYGYVQYDGQAEHDRKTPEALPVRTFAEKPDIETAERFLDSGDFLWNSGIFVWRADAILNAIQHHLPKVFRAFDPLRDALGTAQETKAISEAYAKSPTISIDYGVMERADKVFVVPASFGWSDVGDWAAVHALRKKDRQGNTLKGNVILNDSSRCLIDANQRLVVLIGMHDTIVVDTEDALLICNRESTQQVKNIVDYLHAHRLEDYF